MQQEILTRLDALAAKLGIAAEHIYAVFVVQARVGIIGQALFALTIGLAWLIGVRVVRKYWKVGMEDAPEITICLCVVGSISLAICTMVSISGLAWIPTRLLNPEYWALQEISKMLK